MGHICAILVRNLSLRPTRDRAFQTLTLRRAGVEGDLHVTSDDTDLTLSLTKPGQKGKPRLGTNAGRSRSASWSRNTGSTSDEDIVSTPTRSRFRGNHDTHVPLIRHNSSGAGPDSPWGRSRRSIDPDSSYELSPRPILKRASTTREGDIEPRYTDFLSGYTPGGFFHPSSSSYEATTLSRSDSRSSSRSSHTIKRPEHRARTTSMTSTRSVRFDNTVSRSPSESRRSPRLVGRISDASRLLLFSEKSPSQIMHERLLDCYVELSLTSATDRIPVAESFYKTPQSLPGLHHSWGVQGGPSITPDIDFVTKHRDSPLDASTLWMRLWAKQPDSQLKGHWNLVWEDYVDLRELTPLPGFAQDPSASLPHNTVLLGLAPGANSLSSRDCLAHTESRKGSIARSDKDASSREVNEDEAERIRRVMESVMFYAVPLRAKKDDVSVSLTTHRNRTLGRQSGGNFAAAEGYASDPEAPPSDPYRPPVSPIASPISRRQAFFEQQKRATELSLRETKMMPSYTLTQAKVIVERQAQLTQLLSDVACRRFDYGKLLDDPIGRVRLGYERSQTNAILKDLQVSHDIEKQQLQARLTDLNRRKANVTARRRALASSTMLLKDLTEEQGELEERVCSLRRQKAQLLTGMHSVHARILRDLETIFPIDLLNASSLLFSICGLPLPNAASSISTSELLQEERQWKDAMKQSFAGARPLFHSFDDDTISSALGMVAQLVILLSTYLATPVHYPMATAGSRAVIQDCVSLMSGPRAFPLYSKGVERYRYDYAAFLLNKNVEQLMNVHSVTVIDIRHTLPNLKNLMVTVAAASPNSHLTRKSHIGKSEISLEPKSASNTNERSKMPANLQNGAEFVRAKGLSGLGLGFPTQIRPPNTPVDRSGADLSDAMNPSVKGQAATTDTLVTTRVLGSSKPLSQNNSAIDSVTRALSFFAGSSRG